MNFLSKFKKKFSSVRNFYSSDGFSFRISFHHVIILLLLVSNLVFPQEDSKKVSSQNPSPMVENVREHKRIEKENFDGIDFKINDVLNQPFEIYIPIKTQEANKINLLIHFHGSSIPVKYAIEQQKEKFAAAIINLGTGSKVYYNQFGDSTLFLHLVDSIKSRCEKKLSHKIEIDKIILSGFSAGYGAIKKIISNEKDYQAVFGIILLDGLHASYIPEGKVLYRGGKIDSTSYKYFLKFASDAVNKNGKKFLFTHTEIFPGTFVSTTESADFMLRKMNIKAEPVLKWGPMGTQQISEAKKGSFEIMGFAGNTAPDHIDQLEGLYFFLNELISL